jgi:hypothetical protein
MWLFVVFTGVLGWLSIRWSNNQVKDRHKVKSPQSSSITQDELVSPYYEWVAKDYALSWVRKPDGSIVAVPLTGDQRVERRITGASDIRQMGNDRPYALKMSPDGSKILYFMGGPGSQAHTWRVGVLDGGSYIVGTLLPQTHSPSPVWKRSSQEWVSFIGSRDAISAAHYFIDDVTPRIPIPIRDFASACNSATFGMPNILGLRQDGIAVVSAYGGYEAKSVDIYMVDIDRGRVLPEKHHIILPEGRHTREMSLSHFGDRIAWLFAMAAGQATGGKQTQEEATEVWMSNADGSELKRIFGFAPIVINNASDQKHRPRAVRWTIDDAAISFLQEDGLQLFTVK